MSQLAHASSQATTIVAEVARRTELKGGGKNIASLLAQLRELLCSAARDAPDGPASTCARSGAFLVSAAQLVRVLAEDVAKRKSVLGDSKLVSKDRDDERKCVRLLYRFISEATLGGFAREAAARCGLVSARARAYCARVMGRLVGTGGHG